MATDTYIYIHTRRERERERERERKREVYIYIRKDTSCVCLSILLSIYLSTYLSVYLPPLCVCLSIYLSVYLPTYRLLLSGAKVSMWKIQGLVGLCFFQSPVTGSQLSPEFSIRSLLGKAGVFPPIRF